jgi:hypothetical protein
MSSRLSDAIRRLPVLGPRRRVRKLIERRVAIRQKPRPRPARVPYSLTLTARRIARRNRPTRSYRTCACRDGGSRSMGSRSDRACRSWSNRAA